MMRDRPIHPSLQPGALRRLLQVLAFWAALVCGFAVGQGKAAPTPLGRAMAAVLTVHSADDADRFLGSAFLWGERAEVAVTNAHVVADAAQVRLRDALGREEIAIVLARDPLRDVAVIAVRPGRRGLAVGTEPLQVGDEVWALGAPLGAEFSVTRGVASALSRQVDAAAPVRMLQHDAAVNPGSSGGPLVDAQGALVGMNSRIADGSRMFVGIAYAIPVDQLARIVAGLRMQTLPPLPRLGLRARPMDRALARALGRAPTGLLVEEVEAGGLAGRAGLLPGDILLAVAGRALAQPGDLPFAVEAAQPAGSAELTVLRSGRLMLLRLPLRDGAEPDAPGPATAGAQALSLAALGLVLEAAAIIRVSPGSPAAGAGLAPGDQIMMLNGTVPDAAALAKMVLTAPALFLVKSAGGTRHVLLDPDAKTTAPRPVGAANVLDPAVVVF